MESKIKGEILIDSPREAAILISQSDEVSIVSRINRSGKKAQATEKFQDPEIPKEYLLNLFQDYETGKDDTAIHRFISKNGESTDLYGPYVNNGNTPEALKLDFKIKEGDVSMEIEVPPSQCSNTKHCDEISVDFYGMSNSPLEFLEVLLELKSVKNSLQIY